MHAPITLSGKKCVLNKVHVLNKQVYKYIAMVFFSSNTNILLFVLTGCGFVLPCVHTLRAFSIAGLLNTRLYMAWQEHFMLLKIHIPGNDVGISLQNMCFDTVSSL